MERHRYDTDLTDNQWETLSALLNEHVFTNRLGRPRSICLQEIFNAILYVVRTGCQWRMLPHDFPKWQTVYYHLRQFRLRGWWEQMSDLLRVGLRVSAGRDACPSAAIIDSQSVKTTEAGGPHGYDAGKKINGRKRHIMVDTMGLLLAVVVHVAAIQDRDGAKLVMMRIAGHFSRLKLIWADGGYAGRLVVWAQAFGNWVLQIVKRPDSQKGFAVLPRRWVVERTFAWLGRSRRLSKDYEELEKTSEAMVHISMIQLMLRRLVPS
ncbi:MAG: IS5 family transposase [Phyllobacteriaceae bacterium]|jgi:putative transposase|nr:IS5 family transposase [Phyllobacteriaceae bacterium]